MKKIGLVGGTGPESTAMYYREINSRIDKITGGKMMPDMAIESVDFRRAWGYVCDGKYDILSSYLAEKANALHDSGCEVIALTAGTMHIVYDEVSAKTSSSLVSIPKAVADEVVRRGIRKVGLLGTVFKVGFGSIYEKTEKFSSIPVAVVEESENPAFRQVLENIQSADKPFLKVSFVDKEKAEKLLDDGDAEGIIFSGEELRLTVKEKGLRETMLKSFIEQYSVREKIAMDAINTAPEKAQEVISALTSETVSSCTEIPVTQGNPDVYAQYFYNLIAMVAIFGCITGMTVTVRRQADLSALGARSCCSPVPKSISVLASLAGSFVLQTVCMLICVTFLAFVLKVDFGDRLWLVYPVPVYWCLHWLSVALHPDC